MQIHADDGRARDPGGSPFAARAVLLARANGALSELVHLVSLVAGRPRACSFENAEVELESDERELRDRIAWRSGRLAGRRRAYCSDSSLRNRRTVAPSGWVDVRRLCRPHKSARRSQVRPHAQSRLTHRPRTLAPSASQSVTDRLWPHRFR